MSVLGWLAPALPDVAVTIDRTHVAAVRVERRAGRLTASAEAREALPAGAVSPALAAVNMPDVGVVGQAMQRVLQQLGGRTSRVALVVPDAVAKVSLVHLDKLPERQADLEEIVRWQLRKSAPFPVEQGVLSIGRGAATTAGHDLVVTLARTDVIQQYEQACAMAGAHAGLVDLATFSVMNALIAGGGAVGPERSSHARDWLLVHIAGASLTVAIVRGTELLFFRHRAEETEGTLADLIHQTTMYYEDRLSGGGFSHVWLADASHSAEGASIRAELEARLGAAVQMVEPAATAPLLGVLTRDGEAA
ncbi:MAG: pilus assembly protein PilM [Acidobacteria bacterium]|nr:pilus assembly protein PilM [Acidobacteriota bacterium]